MKIAIINSFASGSTGLLCSYLDKGIKEAGHESLFLYGRGGKSEKGKYIGSSFIRTKINNFLVYVTGKIGHFHKANTKKLIKELEKYKPDVIHINNIHNNYLNFSLLFKYLSTFNGKIVFTLHDQFIFTGHCGYVPLDCKNYFESCKKCPYKNVYQKVLFDRSKKLLEEKKTLIKQLSNIVFVSPSRWLDTFFEGTYLKEKQHIVINNGINLTPAVKKIGKGNKIKLLAVAYYWNEVKGISILNEVASKIDFSKYSLTIVGKITDPNMKLNKNVTYIETLPREELFDLMQSSDIFLNPSLIDNYPTVLIESIMNGLPVITFNSGGCSEIVDNEAGIVLESKTPDSLLKAINNFDFKKFTSEKCIASSKRFLKETMIERYLNLYSNVVEY